MKGRRASCTAFAGMIVLVTRPALAEDGYDVLFARGRAAHQAEKFDEAASWYGKALEKQRTHEVLCNLGGVELDLGRHLPAAEHLAACLQTATGLAEEKRRRLQAALARAKEQVACILVQGVPAGAKAYWRWDQGPEREVPEHRQLFFRGGERYDIMVRVDDETDRQAMTVAKGGELGFYFRPPRPGEPGYVPPHWPWKTPVAVSLGVAGAMSAGIGAGLLGLGVLRGADADRVLAELQPVPGYCPEIDPTKCAHLLGLRRDQDLFLNTGLWLTIAGGVLVAGSVVTVAIPRPRRQAAGLGVRVGLGRVEISGSF